MRTRLISKILLKDCSLDLHAKDNKGKISLHVCGQSPSCETSQILMEMGSDVHVKTKDGVNCLCIAAEVGELDLCKMLLKNQTFNVHMIDDQGGSPLHYCVVSGSYNLYKFIVEMGCDIYLKTKSGKNCLHIATVNGQLNLCKWLWQNSSNINKSKEPFQVFLFFYEEILHTKAHIEKQKYEEKST